MSSIYTLCPIQIPTPSYERLYFSFLQWDALVDIIDLHMSDLCKVNVELGDKPSLQPLYDLAYDYWFLSPGDYVFDREVMQGYFEIADQLLDDPAKLNQLAAEVDSWPFDKIAVDEHGIEYPIEAYTADLFKADLTKLRQFFNKHPQFFFA